MDRDIIKQRLYANSPRSWMTLSGSALLVLPKRSNINAIIETNVIQNFRMQVLRIYMPKASTDAIQLELYVNDELYRNITINAGQTQYTLLLSETKDVFLGDKITLKLAYKNPTFLTSNIYVGFNDSTWEAFLNAIVEGATYIAQEVENLKRDIFLNSAKYLRLDQWASDFTSIERNIYDSDELLRTKVLTEILKPKQTRNAILDAINEIVNQYYPSSEFEFSGSFIGFVSGSGGASGSTNGFSAVLIEPWYQQHPLIPLEDINLPGRFLIALPYAILEDNADFIYADMVNKIEQIKAKGIKVIYAKDYKTDSKTQEFFRRINMQESIFNSITYNNSGSIEQLATTLTGSPANINYISQAEIDNFSEYGMPINVIDIENKFTINIKYGEQSKDESFPFNDNSWILGSSALFNEHISNFAEQDKFIILPFNFDRVKISKINYNGIGFLPDEILFNEIL